MDCTGCKRKQWVAKAREVVQKSDRTSPWGGGDYATAPDGGMQMSREEFKQQLVQLSAAPLSALPVCLADDTGAGIRCMQQGSMQGLQGAEGLPAMDDEQIEDMWVDFSRRIRAGEVSGGAGQVTLPLCSCPHVSVRRARFRKGADHDVLPGLVWEALQRVVWQPPLNTGLAAPVSVGWHGSHAVRTVAVLVPRLNAH
jgi:hypothetical protein